MSSAVYLPIHFVVSRFLPIGVEPSASSAQVPESNYRLYKYESNDVDVSTDELKALAKHIYMIVDTPTLDDTIKDDYELAQSSNGTYYFKHAKRRQAEASARAQKAIEQYAEAEQDALTSKERKAILRQEALADTRGMLRAPKKDQYSRCAVKSQQMNELLENADALTSLGWQVSDVRDFVAGTMAMIEYRASDESEYDHEDFYEELQFFWSHFPAGWKITYEDLLDALYTWDKRPDAGTLGNTFAGLDEENDKKIALLLANPLTKDVVEKRVGEAEERLQQGVFSQANLGTIERVKKFKEGEREDEETVKLFPLLCLLGDLDGAKENRDEELITDTVAMLCHFTDAGYTGITPEDDLTTKVAKLLNA